MLLNAICNRGPSQLFVAKREKWLLAEECTRSNGTFVRSLNGSSWPATNSCVLHRNVGDQTGRPAQRHPLPSSNKIGRLEPPHSSVVQFDAEAKRLSETIGRRLSEALDQDAIACCDNPLRGYIFGVNR